MRIWSRRKQLKMTQEQVAKALGWERPVYARAERGVVVPRIASIYDLAKALHTTPMWIVQDVDRLPLKCHVSGWVYPEDIGEEDDDENVPGDVARQKR